jgi:hypothetical protein
LLGQLRVNKGAHVRILLAASFLALSACGGLRSGAAPASSSSQGMIDWEHPIPDGVEVDSVAAAELLFDPNVPGQLGPNERIVVSSPELAAPVNQEIVWVYDNEFGPFLVVEHVVDRITTWQEYVDIATTPAGCETIPATQKDQDELGAGAGPRIECHAPGNSLTTIRGNVDAYLHEGQITTAVHWLEDVGGPGIAILEGQYDVPALEVTVIGPAETFSTSEALEAAERV